MDVCGGLSLVGNSTLLAANLTVVQGATPAASVASFDVIGATLRSCESFAVADRSAVRVTNASLVNCTVLRVSLAATVSAYVGLTGGSFLVVDGVVVRGAAGGVVVDGANSSAAVVECGGGSAVLLLNVTIAGPPTASALRIDVPTSRGVVVVLAGNSTVSVVQSSFSAAAGAWVAVDASLSDGAHVVVANGSVVAVRGCRWGGGALLLLAAPRSASFSLAVANGSHVAVSDCSLTGGAVAVVAFDAHGAANASAVFVDSSVVVDRVELGLPGSGSGIFDVGLASAVNCSFAVVRGRIVVSRTASAASYVSLDAAGSDVVSATITDGAVVQVLGCSGLTLGGAAISVAAPLSRGFALSVAGGSVVGVSASAVAQTALALNLSAAQAAAVGVTGASVLLMENLPGTSYYFFLMNPLMTLDYSSSVSSVLEVSGSS